MNKMNGVVLLIILSQINYKFPSKKDPKWRVAIFRKFQLQNYGKTTCNLGKSTCKNNRIDNTLKSYWKSLV